jgi:hypothetical protein
MFRIYVTLFRFALLGLPSEEIHLYFDPRCGKYHRKGA